MIIVTKSGGNGKKSGKSPNLLQQAQENRRWKKKPMDAMEHTADTASDILIYSFPYLDDVISVSLRLDGRFQGESAVYKNENKYFLILQGNTYTAEDVSENLELILKEYGQKHISTPLAKYYLLEHGETIIADKAVKALAKTFG